MATFGVTHTFGGTNPGGYLQSSEQTQEVEVATIKNADGRVAEAIPKPRKKTTVTIRSKGEAVLATVGSGSESMSLTSISAKYSQTNDDFSSSEVTYQSFANL